MTKPNTSLVDELQQSLSTLQQIGRSTRASILMMIGGVLIVVASFIYSITRLQPLERQINQKQETIRNLDQGIGKLKQDKAAVEQELASTMKELDYRKEDLLKLKSKDMSGEEVVSHPVVQQVTGWAYYGFTNGENSWTERFFKKAADDPGGVPKVGEVVVATAMVNMREGYITYDEMVGWYNKPVIGLIRPQQRFVVTEIGPLKESVWVQLRRVK